MDVYMFALCSKLNKGFKSLFARVMVNAFILCIIFVCSTACSKFVKKQGYSFGDLGNIERKIGEIKVGHTGEIEVLKILGSPSTMSNFGPDTFFYIQNCIEEKGFYRPVLVAQKVVAIEFDDGHVVRSVKQYELKDSVIVPYDKNASVYIKANELKIIDQLKRNVGRFGAHKRSHK
jgi:outer membrane protein assembly factor BamE (lipoprotein component of BamABCDE complex)